MKPNINHETKKQIDELKEQIEKLKKKVDNKGFEKAPAENKGAAAADVGGVPGGAIGIAKGSIAAPVEAIFAGDGPGGEDYYYKF